jgi:uroporphyrinogen decarboxylase
MTIDYLRYQIEAGAVAVQLFESAAFLLDEGQYKEFSLPYQQRVFEAIKGFAPTIMFAREWDRVDDLDASGADVLSLPSSITIAEARGRVGADRIIQGNLDNRLLAEGTLAQVEAATKACVDSGGRKGHIFNLSHGLLRETPYENVQHVVRVVREYI